MIEQSYNGISVFRDSKNIITNHGDSCKEGFHHNNPQSY